MHVMTRTSRLIQLTVLTFVVVASHLPLYAEAEDQPQANDRLTWKKPHVGQGKKQSVTSTPKPFGSATQTVGAKMGPRLVAAREAVQSATHQTPLQAEPSGATLIQQAYERSRQGDSEGHYSTIIAQCERGIRQGVSRETERYAERLLSWAYNRRGTIAAEMGREQQALEDFEAAVRYDSTRWRALHNRGVSYALIGRLEEAVADFTRTIELNPRHANAYFNRGELRYKNGQFDKALKDYGRAVQLTPDDSAAYNSRGHTYYHLHKYPEAVRDFTEALRLDPQNSAALANRGLLYSDLGYYARALRDFQRAVDLDPELGHAYQGAAWVLATCPKEKYRDAEAAVAAASKAIELDGDDDPLYLDTLAAAHANSGRFDMAQEAVRAALEKAPEELQKQMKRRLTAYKQKRPYRSRPQQVASVVKQGAKRPIQRGLETIN